MKQTIKLSEIMKQMKVGNKIEVNGWIRGVVINSNHAQNVVEFKNENRISKLVANKNDLEMIWYIGFGTFLVEGLEIKE